MKIHEPIIITSVFQTMLLLNAFVIIDSSDILPLKTSARHLGTFGQSQGGPRIHMLMYSWLDCNNNITEHDTIYSEKHAHCT